LEIVQLNDGGTKSIWHEQSNPYDRNVTHSNQVAKRIKELFPKIKTETETRIVGAKGRSFISGLTFSPNSPHHPHHSTTASYSSSPSSSQSVTDPLPLFGKDELVKSEEGKDGSEVETLAIKGSKDGEDELITYSPPGSPDWRPITTVGLENLYMGDWVARLDNIPLKLGIRRKNFWEAIIPDSDESLEVPFSEIIHVYR
jgi:hypothetical protein